MLVVKFGFKPLIYFLFEYIHSKKLSIPSFSKFGSFGIWVINLCTYVYSLIFKLFSITPIYQSFYLSILLSIYIFIYLTIYQSTYRSIYLSIFPSLYVSVLPPKNRGKVGIRVSLSNFQFRKVNTFSPLIWGYTLTNG